MIARIRALAHKAAPQKDRLEINDVIPEVIALARQRAAPPARVAADASSPAALPLVLGDRIQLQQVLLNLLLNGIEALSGVATGRERCWSARTPAEAAGVRVARPRFGPWLDPQGLDRIFDAFYTTKAAGLGMGLAISRSIIEAHGGRLWATANAPRGAIFQFTLPIGGAGGAMTEADAIVFVVDDDAAMRRSLENLIRSVGLRVEVFASAQDFLRSHRPGVPGCLVLDVRLPGLSGLDLQKRMAEADLDIPIVFITGHGDIPMTRAGDEGGGGGVPDQAVPRPGPARRHSAGAGPRPQGRRAAGGGRGAAPPVRLVDAPRAGSHGARGGRAAEQAGRRRSWAPAKPRSRSTAIR